MTEAAKIEKRLHRFCNRFRGRVRRTLLEYGLLRAATFLAVLAAVLMFSDWYFRFSHDGRLWEALSLLALAGFCFWYDLRRPLRHSWSDTEVLGYLDRAVPDGQDSLVCLRELSNPQTMREADTEEGRQIISEVVGELEAKTNKMDLRGVVRRRSLNRWRTAVLALAGLYVVAALLPPHLLWTGVRRILNPWSNVTWPQKTHLIVVTPDDGTRVPKGEPLSIIVRIEGEVPAVVNIHYKNKSGKRWVVERMAVVPGVDPALKEKYPEKLSKADGIAKFNFGDMVEPLTFYCQGGDDYEQNRVSVAIAERPMITKITALYTYPKYARQQRKKVFSGQLRGLEGTTVDAEFTTSKELKKAEITFRWEGREEETKPEKIAVDGEHFKYTFSLTRNGTYTLHLTDTENLANGKPERYEISVVPDEPPEITLTEPKGDMILTSKGWIHLAFKVKDDFNLNNVQVLLGPPGTAGVPLSDRITGPLLDPTRVLHPVSEGDFKIDFLKEKKKGTFKQWNIERGVDLEMWIKAVDCNPAKDAAGRPKGTRESMRVMLSFLSPTDFMEEVVRKATDLMTDARTGWFSAAAAYYDGTKWSKSPTNDDDLQNVLDQEATAERSATALDVRFPEIYEHMTRNRMQKEFMSKRLDRIAVKIAELKKFMPEIGKQIASGRPKSAEESVPEARRRKMAKALGGAAALQNEAAWKFKFLYNRLADWVALQSVLLKTRRIEETQKATNAATEKLIQKTIGLEKEEYDEDTVREMLEVTHRQQTVHDIEKAVEEELKKLIKKAEKDGRRKVLRHFGGILAELRNRQIQSKLKRATLAIGDARGATIRDYQKEVLSVVRDVNVGLEKAGEEVPDDPPPAGIIPDPRKTAEDAGEVNKAAEFTEQDMKNITRGHRIRTARTSLEGTLQKVFDLEEDLRNRTRFKNERVAAGGRSPRYLRLSTRLMNFRQGLVVNLLNQALEQADKYGEKKKGEKTTEGEVELPPDPTNKRARGRLKTQLGDFRDSAVDSQKMLSAGDFSGFCSGLQDDVRLGMQDLRVYIQNREDLHKQHMERKAKKYLDEFDRKFLLNGDNFVRMTDEAKNLEWALVRQEAARRETALLAKAASNKRLSAPAKSTVERLKKSVVGKQQEVLALVKELHETAAKEIKDPTDPEKENEKVKPELATKVLQPLSLSAFQEALAGFGPDKQDYGEVAGAQKRLSDSLGSVLVSLKDMFDERVKPPAPKEMEKVSSEVLVDNPNLIYEGEGPGALAERLRDDGGWLDKAVGPEVRARLIKELEKLAKEKRGFDPRYQRLISAYFQAVAQNFQRRAKNVLERERKKKAAEGQ